jgi:hypothetical protein
VYQVSGAAKWQIYRDNSYGSLKIYNNTDSTAEIVLTHNLAIFVGAGTFGNDVTVAKSSDAARFILNSTGSTKESYCLFQEAGTTKGAVLPRRQQYLQFCNNVDSTLELTLAHNSATFAGLVTSSSLVVGSTLFSSSFEVRKSNSGASGVSSFINSHNTAGDFLVHIGVGPNSSDTTSTFIRFWDSGVNAEPGHH